jgi:hypothetical protein
VRRETRSSDSPSEHGGRRRETQESDETRVELKKRKVKRPMAGMPRPRPRVAFWWARAVRWSATRYLHDLRLRFDSFPRERRGHSIWF